MKLSAYLFHELDRAKELHRSEANAGREGVIHSVETVLKFLQLFAPVISSALHTPLIVLFNALMSLDDGGVLPVLKPANKTGRRASERISEIIDWCGRIHREASHGNWDAGSCCA